MEAIRTLIIDSHPDVRRALSERLSNSDSIQVISASADMADGRIWMERERPDAVLVGLRAQEDPRDMTDLAEMSSHLATWRAALLVLTSFSLEDERRDILRAGARRYLLKDIDTNHLIDEIQDSVLEARALNQSSFDGGPLLSVTSPGAD